MKFLIKDLSRLTGISPARIRKWQERYHLLNPEKASNGYHYYSNEDYIILKNLKARLAKGERLKNLLSIDRSLLLKPLENETFSAADWELLRFLQNGDFIAIHNYLEQKRTALPLACWVHQVLKPLAVMVGTAWEQGIISIGEEHAFSRWFMGYILNLAEQYRTSAKPIWLVTVFPGDEHELGALMHYLLLLKHKVAARFVGSLPDTALLIKEIKTNRYRAVSISIVIPQKPENIQQLKKLLLSTKTIEKVFFGGFGLKNTAAKE